MNDRITNYLPGGYMSIELFKSAIIAFFLNLLTGEDERVKQLESDLTTAIATADGLKTENAALKQQLTDANMAIEADAMTDQAELDAALTEIKERFTPSPSPTPVSDNFVQAVESSKVIPTPTEIITDTTVGTSTETPVEVKVAAVDAIVEAVVENMTEDPIEV